MVGFSGSDGGKMEEPFVYTEEELQKKRCNEKLFF
jgi:hypothetical protein